MIWWRNRKRSDLTDYLILKILFFPWPKKISLSKQPPNIRTITHDTQLSMTLTYSRDHGASPCSNNLWPEAYMMPQRVDLCKGKKRVSTNQPFNHAGLRHTTKNRRWHSVIFNMEWLFFWDGKILISNLVL